MKKNYRVEKVIKTTDKFGRELVSTISEYLYTDDVRRDIKIFGWDVIRIELL